MSIIYPLLLEDGGGINLQDDYYLLSQYTPSGINDNITLYLSGSISVSGQSDLYVMGVSKESDIAYLTINGEYNELYNSLNLVILNDYPEEEITLYIRGTGSKNNYIPFNSFAYLYIHRPNDVLTMPMFCKVADYSLNTYCNLHTVSREEDDGSATLYTSGISGVPNTYSTMFVFGSYIENNNMTMSIPNVFIEDSNSMELFLSQGNVESADSTTMYVNGANIVAEGINLSLGSAHDIYNKTESLYIFGWG